MTLGELDEAMSVIKVMMTALLGTLSGQVGRNGGTLRYAVGDFLAAASGYLKAGTIGLPMLYCFQVATAAGASIAGMERVRLALGALTPVGLPGLAVLNAGVRFALSQECQILAGTTFTSSQDVFAALAQQNDAYDAAEEYAADNHDPAAFQALIQMQAAVTRDLTTRAANLPALVTYTMPRILTSHALANRLYGDASRADELRAEGKIINPAFMPRTGTALSE